MSPTPTMVILTSSASATPPMEALAAIPSRAAAVSRERMDFIEISLELKSAKTIRGYPAKGRVKTTDSDVSSHISRARWQWRDSKGDSRTQIYWASESVHRSRASEDEGKEYGPRDAMCLEAM